MIYTPREDSYLLQEEVKKFSKERKVLDMGSGSGIQARTAIVSGAKFVLATDINQEAVDHLIKIGINAVKSDLFSNITGKFDLIIFNPPYLPEDKREDKESALTTSGGKKGDELTVKFLKEADQHLNDKGIILLLISSLTPKNKINFILYQKTLKYEIISVKKMGFEELQVWKIEKENTKI